MKRILISLLILLWSSVCFSATFYVDAVGIDSGFTDEAVGCSTPSDTDYNVTTRQCGSGSEDVYNTVQGAITAMSAGDTTYMREGTHDEQVSIPNNKQGSAGNLYTLMSYTGEWAIIDGVGAGATLEYEDGSYSVCPTYWLFSNFEVTGGGNGGIMLDTAHHITFQYLYIHDNSASSGSNDGGIVIKNDTQTAQYITIKYSWLEDTTCTNDPNCATVSFFSDYNGYDIPPQNDIDEARHHNEVAYNRVIGGVQGIRSKSWQVLTMDHTAAGGDNPASYYDYEDYGDKIHHNIVEDFLGVGIEARQDFIQVYNNIVSIDTGTSRTEMVAGIMLGCQEYNTDREPFYAVAYNNLSIGSDITIEHQTNGIYSPDIHPYSYLYNNIVESSTEHMQNRIDFSIASNSVNAFADIDMDTIWFENNLFVPRTTSVDVMRIEDLNRTITEWKTDGYSTTVYNATSTTGLHKSGSNYTCEPEFSLGGSDTIDNGGYGLSHPYLPGITIPSYVGAADPNDDDWVAGVLNLNVAYLTAATGDPSWIEGGEGDTSPPTPNPATWQSEPSDDSSTQISMTATTGSDSTPPIEYYFTEGDHSGCLDGTTGPGGTSSGWQSADTTYTDGLLGADTCYGYTVTTRDAIPNTGTASANFLVYTSAITPGAPTLSSPTPTTLDIQNEANANQSHTTFAVQCTSVSGGGDASWLNKWVSWTTGGPIASESWNTDSNWDGRTIISLTSGLQYGFKVKARNSDAVNRSYTPLSTEGQGTTTEDSTPPIDGVTGFFCY